MANSAVVGVLRALLTLDQAEFERGIRKADDHLKAFGRSTRQIGAQATQLGSTLTRTLTLPILGFGGAMAKAAIDFESSFAGVRKTVEASEAEFAAIAQQFRDLSKQIPVNVNELNRLGEAAGALGIQKEAIVEFARVMAMLGVTTNVTSEQAAESIAKIQNIFQATGKETENFASTLVALGNDGASTESQILELANRIASAGHAVGLSQGEVLGFASAIANVGIEAEAGGSAISRVFIDIATAVSDGGAALDQFAKVAGVSSKAFADTFKTDAAAATKLFIEGLEQLHHAGGDLIKTLEDLGFKELRQANLLRSLALSGDNLAKALKLQNEAWRENSALSVEAQERFKTTASQITLLWNRVKDLGITIGNALLPMIQASIRTFDALIPFLEKAAAVFANLPTGIQTVIVAMGLAIAAAGPLIFAFGQLALAASQLAMAFGKKGIATKALTALLAGPAGLKAAVTSAGAAFTASSVAVAGFTAALAAIVVPLALIKIVELIQQVHGLISDQSKWRIDALQQVSVHQRTMAEASKIAGREVTTLAEAMEILRHEALRLQGVQQGLIGDGNKRFVILKGFGPQVKEAAQAEQTYSQQLAKVRAELAALTPAQRREIEAAQLLGVKTEDLEKKYGLTAGALRLLSTDTKDYEKSLKGATKATDEAAAAHRAFLNMVGEREIEDIEREIKAHGEATRADVDGLSARIALTGELQEERDALAQQDRDYANFIAERLMEAEGARLKKIEDAHKAHRDRIVAFWKGLGTQLERAAIGSLGTLFFGQLGHDPTGELRAAADEAQQEYLKLQRTGKATAKELEVAFNRWRDAEDRANLTFGQRWKEFLGGIKRTFVNVLNDMLAHFLGNFLKGMLNAIGGAKLGQSLGNALLGGATNAAAGVGAGALLGGGASFIAADVAGVAAGAGGGTAAAAGGAGAMAGLGAFFTNPWTIGIGAGILAAIGIKKFAGPSEAYKARELQGTWQRSIGPAGVELIQTLFNQRKISKALMDALFDPMSSDQFKSAVNSIAPVLSKNGGQPFARSFSLGGFVPPGAIQPAILHGGRLGEIIVPLDKMLSRPNPQAERRDVHIHATFNSLDPSTAKQVFVNEFLPMLHMEMNLNQHGTNTLFRKVTKP